MLGKNLEFSLSEYSGPERRRGHRFQLRLTCRVTFPWKDSRELPGSTADISRSGVKVVFENAGKRDELPGIREPARILIDLPHSSHISPRCLECWGVIVRTELLKTQRLAAAFEIRRIRVCDQSGQPSQPDDSPLANLLLRGPIQ